MFCGTVSPSVEYKCIYKISPTALLSGHIESCLKTVIITVKYSLQLFLLVTLSSIYADNRSFFSHLFR